MKLSNILTAGAAISCLQMAAPMTASAQDAMLGEVKQFATNFCPRGWAETNGQILSISENTALFSLLGTMYGGDGRTTFALPDFRPQTTSAPAPQQAGGEARVYQHCDMAGWSQPLGLGDYSAADFGAPFEDDNVSAVTMSPGWTVELFDGPNQTGDSVTITGEDSCLVNDGFNDRASSFRVTRAEAPAPAPVAEGPTLKTCIAIVGIYPSRS